MVVWSIESIDERAASIAIGIELVDKRESETQVVLRLRSVDCVGRMKLKSLRMTARCKGA